MQKSVTRLIAAVIFGALPVPSSAQDLGGYYSGMAFNGLVTNQVNIAQRGVSRNVTRQALGQDVRGFTPRNEATVAAPASPIPYKVSAERRRANLAQFVAKSRAGDPQGAAEMEELFAQGDFIAAVGAQIKPLGLRVDNLADAYAVYWVSAWQAAHGDTRTLDRATMQAAKRQAAAAMDATPEVTTATDTQKQEFAEALLVQASLIGAMQDKYKDDRKLMPRVAAAVRQGAKASGLDLDAMTLTDEGFVPADKVGAHEAPAGGKAAASPILLAAAGGVGLGAVFLAGRAFGRRG